MAADREVVEERLARLEEAVSRLRRTAGIDRRSFLGDRDEQLVTEREMQVALQAMIDLAAQVVAEERLGAAGEYRELLDRLVERGFVAAGLGARLRDAVGLRDLLVHQYLRVDPDRLHDYLRGGLEDLEEFSTAVLRWAEA